MRRKKLYFENLDALRFFAAFLVISYHISIWLSFPNNFFGKISRIILSMDSSGGTAGVKFFFVLSGFLITYLMFVEQSEKNSFSILRFYLRRLLRIWPLYFLVLFIGFVIYPRILHSDGFVEQANPILYAAFLANIDNVFGDRPETGILGVQWSVSVEEQFYLIWPLLFLLFIKRGHFIWVIFSSLIVSFVFNQQGGNSYHLLSCIQELSLGALAAWVSFFYRPVVDQFFQLLSKRITLLIYLLGVMFIFLGFQLNKNFSGIGHLHSFFASVFFVFVIIEQNYSTQSFFKAGSCRLLTYWGKRSYGLYLLHMVAITFSLMISNSLLGEILLTISITLILCELSYKFVEHPLLNLKEKLQAQAAYK